MFPLDCNGQPTTVNNKPRWIYDLEREREAERQSSPKPPERNARNRMTRAQWVRYLKWHGKLPPDDHEPQGMVPFGRY